MSLTNYQIIDLMDCVNNRMVDLTDCAMFGDADEIEDEIERMHTLINKLSEALEAE